MLAVIEPPSILSICECSVLYPERIYAAYILFEAAALRNKQTRFYFQISSSIVSSEGKRGQIYFACCYAEIVLIKAAYV